MGRHLQIRVMARTVDPDALVKEWPHLIGLAWPDYKEMGPRPGQVIGVLELPVRLDEERRFNAWSAELTDALGPGLDKALELTRRLEEALADWIPREANILSDELEDVLDQLDKTAKRALK